MGICTSCQAGTLEPSFKSSPFWIIKESVTNNEKEQGKIFTYSGKNKFGYSENTSSYFLGKEMGRVGLNLLSFNLSCLYLHDLPKNKRTKDGRELIQGCQDYSISELIKATQGAKIVLLMGAEIVRLFTGYGVSDVSGLVCKSPLLSNVPVIIPAPNPDKIMAQPIGELRNALAVLAEQIKVYNQYSKI